MDIFTVSEFPMPGISVKRKGNMSYLEYDIIDPWSVREILVTGSMILLILGVCTVSGFT